MSTREERAARLVQLLDRADGLRELHQREDSLLHAGAARGGDRHQRHAARARALARSRELLSDHASHGAAHEGEVHDRQPTPLVLDRRAAADHRVAEAGVDLGFREPLGVRAKVEERERVGRAQLGVLLARTSRGLPVARSAPGRHRKVVAALRADAKVLSELVVAIVRPAAGARVGVRLPLAGPVPFCLDRHVDVAPDREDMRWILRAVEFRRHSRPQQEP